MFLYFFIDILASNKLGSIKVFDFLIFLNDLYANIAIGSSVQPKIIFLHLIFIKWFTAGLIAFSASLTLPVLTSLIALFTEFNCSDLVGLTKLKYLSKYLL